MARFARFLITLLLIWSAGILPASPVAVLHAQDTTYARHIIRDLTAPSMYGRGMQNRGDSIAADYVRNELKAMGVKPLCKDYYQYFHFPNTTSRPPIVKAGYRSQNVCGYLPGETDTMIVFTAHYEHLGMHGDTIFFGAHDNASGTAAVLDMARMLSAQPRHYTYVFLFFGGEEAGLVGSGFFADMPLIKMNKVKLLVNIDLFCGGDEGLIVVNANARETKPYVDLLQRINDERGYAAKIGRRDNAANSDHYYLSQYCPAIFIYTLGGPYGGYHSPTDTCDDCGLGNYPRFLTLLRSFLEAL
ncbi:MAG: M28 family peptidase [Bacteroidales bacterium]|nr:M28 family peptidase [Bacteroidales bacterium]